MKEGEILSNNIKNGNEPLFELGADEICLKIMFVFAEKELCVQELTLVLNASSSLVSNQMRTLKFMKLVKQRREGKVCSIS